MPLRTIVLGMVLGVVVEGLARLFRWWEFRRSSLLVVQIVLVYGLVMGGLASFVPRLGPFAIGLVAALVGLCSELLNVAFLHWWRFLDGRNDSSAGRLAVIVVLALGWGTVPPLLARADVALQRALGASSAQDALQALEQRQRYLLQKREDLLLRLRDVDNRLRALDRRKQRLQERARQRQPRAEAVPARTIPGEQEEAK